MPTCWRRCAGARSRGCASRSSRRSRPRSRASSAEWQGVVPAPASPRAAVPDALLDVVEQLQGAAFPAQRAGARRAAGARARLPRRRPRRALRGGRGGVGGVQPLGERDGRIALYPRRRPAPAAHAAARTARGRAARGRCARTWRGTGASFFAELHGGVRRRRSRAARARRAVGPRLGGRGDERHAGRAARVPAPAASAARAPPRAGGAFRSRRAVAARAVGRWSLRRARPRGTGADRHRAREGARGAAPRPPRRATRQAVMAEGVAGRLRRASTPCCKALEEAGRIRRGYFVAGLGGSQFALPGALDRLRGVREPRRDDEDAARGRARRHRSRQPLRRRAALAGRGWRAAPCGRRASTSRSWTAPWPRWWRAGTREILPVLPEGEPARTRTARGLAAALARWALRTGRTSLGLGRRGRPTEHAALAAPCARPASCRGARASASRARRRPPRPAWPSPRAGDGDDPDLRGRRPRGRPERCPKATRSGASRTASRPCSSAAASPRLRLAAPALASAARRHRVEGSTVVAVEARGKHLLVRFSTGVALHTHLGMTGSWHLYRAGSRWRQPAHLARVVLEADGVVAVCFVPRVVELVPEKDEAAHPTLTALGPDVVAGGFDAAAAVARLQARADVGDRRRPPRSDGAQRHRQHLQVRVAVPVRRRSVRAGGRRSTAALRRLVETAHRLMRRSVVAPDAAPGATGSGDTGCTAARGGRAAAARRSSWPRARARRRARPTGARACQPRLRRRRPGGEG